MMEISDVLPVIAALFPLDSLPWLPEFFAKSPFDVDMSIESMKSKQFSVGIFYFLVVGILVFTGIIAMFMFKRGAHKLKTGEKWMFAWILMGVVAATIFGATQLLHGFLF